MLSGSGGKSVKLGFEDLEKHLKYCFIPRVMGWVNKELAVGELVEGMEREGFEHSINKSPRSSSNAMP